MTTTNIEELFDESRFPSGVAVLPFILYFPFGLVLAVLRLFIGFHTFIVACLLPKMTSFRSSVLRCMCGILGIWVTRDDPGSRDPKVKMLVANYTSALDHLAMELLLPNILPSVWDLPPLLMWILGYKDMGAKQGRQTLIQNATKHCQSSTKVPLLAFPEGASTNGKTGLLKFSVWPFSLDHPVQPVVIHLSRPPFARVAPSVLGGRWWLDIFWFLFVPYTHFTMKVLPPLEQTDEETPDEFTKRTQSAMAKALGVEVTSHTCADKVEYAKRKLFTQTHTSHHRDHTVTNSPQPDPVLGLCQQVKEVLPHVPISVIRTDLALTKDVDLTITNIIEGRVQFVPEEPGVEATPSPPSAHPNHLKDSPTTMNTSPQPSVAPSFSKSSKHRELSLADRKKALLDSARRRYLEQKEMI